MLLPSILMLALVLGPSAGDRAEIAPLTTEKIEVDGLVDEPAWAPFPWFDGFVQQAPSEGEPATERTRFKIAHDDDAIYVFVEALDSDPKSIQGQLTRRDADSASDWIHLWLDPSDDRRTAFRFSVNAAGVKQDARLEEGLADDLDWNAVWVAVARTSTTGWAVEMRIPLSELRYTEGHPHWGFEVGRDVSRLHERSFFAPVPKGTSRLTQHFGELEGVAAIPSVIDASAVPYVSGSLKHLPDEKGPAATGGGDARIGLGSSMVLDLTINPDFAQVEADPSVLNLSTQETYFNEKRPFFIAGKDLFTFGLGFGDGDLGLQTLFYSRRVGTDRVLGAAKLTGKSTEGWSVGVLEALSGGTTDEVLNNASVVRATRDVGDHNTKVGVMGTYLVQRLDEPERLEKYDDSFTAGVDFDHRAGNYELTLELYGSRIDGSRESITALQNSPVHNFARPDAGHLEVDPELTSLSGWGFTALAQKVDGPHVRGAIGAIVFSPKLDTNALGYMPYADRQTGIAWLQLREDVPGSFYENWAINFNAWATQTFGAELASSGGNINGSVTLHNYWILNAGVGPDLQSLDVTLLHGGPAMTYPTRWNVWCGFETDGNQPFVLKASTFAAWALETHGDYWEVLVEAIAKPTSWLELSVKPFYSYHHQTSQFIDFIDDDLSRPVIARLAHPTFSLAFRANWTISPDLSLQLYIAPYLTAGTYSDYREVTAPRAATYDERVTSTAPIGDPRFEFAEVRGNLVVRWEYRLGSTVYFVWSHGQTRDVTDVGALRLGRDFRALGRAPSEDIVLVKIAHRFDL